MGINKVKSWHQQLGHFNSIRLHQLMFVSIGLIIFKKMILFYFFVKHVLKANNKRISFQNLKALQQLCC
jgi:hypothetical protein